MNEDGFVDPFEIEREGTPGPIITAGFESLCENDCGRMIRPGDQIIAYEGGWSHAACLDEYVLEYLEGNHFRKLRGR